MASLFRAYLKISRQYLRDFQTTCLCSTKISDHHRGLFCLGQKCALIKDSIKLLQFIQGIQLSVNRFSSFYFVPSLGVKLRLQLQSYLEVPTNLINKERGWGRKLPKSNTFTNRRLSQFCLKNTVTRNFTYNLKLSQMVQTITNK